MTKTAEKPYPRPGHTLRGTHTYLIHARENLPRGAAILVFQDDQSAAMLVHQN